MQMGRMPSRKIGRCQAAINVRKNITQMGLYAPKSSSSTNVVEVMERSALVVLIPKKMDLCRRRTTSHCCASI